ncbi:MAG: bestrophin family ion channel [Bacteroidota bacterium]|nr:bestrophin family ion channel [Bacteroidota bacterium]
MVTYNPKDWLKLIIQFHKTDTARTLLWPMLLIGAITAAIEVIEKIYIKEPIEGNVTIFHQISGFIISLVLVFRINTAYDRWWEGRKLWGGLLNSCRNLSIKMHALMPKNSIEERKEIAAMISNYAYVLKEHLRNNSPEKLVAESSYINKAEYTKSNHKPNYIAKQLTEYIINISQKNPKTQYDSLLISSNLNDLTDICGACERIKNTPIPYSYNMFIKRIVFVYIITMPIAFGFSVGYWSIPVVMVMFYAFASLELISEEIEDPFGYDENDLPTDEIAEKIKLNVHEILLD